MRKHTLLPGIVVTVCFAALPAIASAPAAAAAPKSTTASVAAHSPPPATAPAVATIEDARALFDQKRYDDALAGIDKLVKKSGGTSISNLVLLRGDCYLEKKQFSLAIQAYVAAKKQATDENNKKTVARADAYASLLKNSPGGAYTPKTGTDKKAIDIVDPDSRIDALSHHLDDQFAAISSAADAAAKTDDVDKLLDASRHLGTVVSLERVVTGRAAKCSNLSLKMGRSVTTAFEKFENDDNRLIQAAAVDSHTQVVVGHTLRGVPIMGPRGLNAAGVAALRQIMDQCAHMDAAITELRDLLDQPSLMLNADDRTKRIATRASGVLNGGNDPSRQLTGNQADRPSTDKPFSDY